MSYDEFSVLFDGVGIFIIIIRACIEHAVIKDHH